MKSLNRFFKISFFVLLLGVLALFKTTAADAGELKMHTVSILHGDAIIIESKGHYMLVDSGESANAHFLMDYLAKLNIPDKNIDYVVATHPDADHVGGFKKVYSEYNVLNTIYNDVSKTTASYTKFVTAMLDEGTPSHNPVDGESWKLGDATVSVVYDGRQGTTFNESSIVLKVKCDNKYILLTGDLPSTMEDKLISKGYNFKADVLKVGHHGAALSTNTAFLKNVKPTHAVISCGPKDDEFQFPKDSVLERLAKVFAKTYCTVNGDVVLNIKDNNITTTAKEMNPYKSITKGTLVLSSTLLTAAPIAGDEVTPGISLYVDGNLINPNYYSTDFSDNTHTGTASVKVTGNEKGTVRYVGSLKSTFYILPRKTKIYTASRTTNKKIYLHWSAQKNASGYTIRYATDKKFTKNLKTKTIKNPSKNTYTIKGLNKKKTYYVSVRAYTNNIGEGKWSKTSKVKKLKTVKKKKK